MPSGLHLLERLLNPVVSPAGRIVIAFLPAPDRPFVFNRLQTGRLILGCAKRLGECSMKGEESKLRKMHSHSRGRASVIAPESIRVSAQRLRAILDATTEGYGYWKISSGILTFGDRFLLSLGYSHSNLPKGHKHLVHPDDRVAFEAQLRALVAGDIPIVHYELRIRTKAGLYRWFELRGRAVRNDEQTQEIACTLHDIQASKDRQERLLLSHERLMATLQAAEECILVFDPVESKVVLFNKAFEDLAWKAHGVRVRCGMTLEDIRPDTAGICRDFLKQVLQQGTISLDYQVPSTNVTYHLSAQTLVRDRTVYGICLYGYDITSRKRIEEAVALLRSKEKFFTAFQQGPSPMALTSLREHRYIEVNDAFIELTGYSRDEILGKSYLELGIWVDPEQRAALAQTLMAGGDVRDVDVKYRTKSGEIRESVLSAVLIDINGEPCAIGVSQDVTERKRTIEALQESEERLRLAVESGHMYAFEWNPITDQVRRSRQAEKLLNLREDRPQHTKQELIEMILPEDREQYVQTLNSLTPGNASYRVGFRLLREDGSTLWLEESGKAFFQPDGKISKVVGMTFDVTDIRESERTLRDLSRRLISTQEEERRRIARELHDHIGQELALLCVQAQRLASGKPDPDSTAHNEPYELYKRIKEIATDVSKLSHRLHSSELDFLGLAVAAERLSRDFASQYGLVIDYVSKNVPPKIDLGKTLCFYRVLQEALQNIAKHSHASRVAVVLETSNSQLRMTVSDDGIGFDTKKVRFESGLGLISIRERLNQVGGRFALRSKLGAGTTLEASVAI